MCVGSSLFLKSVYGVGYYLTLVKAGDNKVLFGGSSDPQNF